MSTQPTHHISRPLLDEQAVAEFLRGHPDFFDDQPELLAELVLPHPSGKAVSLIERQVSQLREQNQRLRQQLQSLVRNARNNEILSERIHNMTLALLHVNALDNLFSTLHDRLRKDFDADAVTVCLVSGPDNTRPPAPHEEGLIVRHINHSDLHNFDKILESNGPVCGRLTHRQMHYLFSDGAGDINSVALIPLKAATPPQQPVLLGIIGIGSPDTHRFQAGMGTVFLNQLADIVSSILRRHIE